jgi:hypothetical protein
MFTRKILLLLLTLVSAPAVLSAQTPEERIEAARGRVTAAGIPDSLLNGRVALGKARGVSAERIAASVERRATALTAAQQAMGGPGRELTPADLNAGADAIQARVPAATLRTLTERAQGADRPVAIAVLAQLYHEGLSAAEALERVTGALGKGPDALRTLPAEVAAERRRTQPPPAGR